MSEPGVEVETRGLRLEVVAAGACFCICMCVVASTAVLDQRPPSLMLLGGWPLFALAGAVVLDRRPGEPVGRALAAVGLAPLLDCILALVRTGGDASSADLAGAVVDLAGWHVVLLVAPLLWTTRPPTRPAAGAAAVAVALVGAARVLASASVVGWTLVALGLVGLVALLLHDVRRAERTERRRLVLITATFGAGGAVVVFAAATARAEIAGSSSARCSSSRRCWSPGCPWPRSCGRSATTCWNSGWVSGRSPWPG